MTREAENCDSQYGREMVVLVSLDGKSEVFLIVERIEGTNVQSIPLSRAWD